MAISPCNIYMSGWHHSHPFTQWCIKYAKGLILLSLDLVNHSHPYCGFFYWQPSHLQNGAWASYQIHRIAGCACARNAMNVFRAQRVSDPDMHHGTCVILVLWCMSGSLTGGFLWSRWRGKRFRHSRRMRNPQFYVSGKRPAKYEISLRRCAVALLFLTLCRGTGGGGREWGWGLVVRVGDIQ